MRSQGFTAGLENHSHIRDAEAAADRASTLLSDAVGFQVNAIPCVVVLDSRTLTIAKPPRRVAVLTPRQLPGWLTQLPPVLSAHEAALLGMYAEERSTWNEEPCEQEDVRECVHRFRQLQDAVSTARRRPCALDHRRHRHRLVRVHRQPRRRRGRSGRACCCRTRPAQSRRALHPIDELPPWADDLLFRQGDLSPGAADSVHVTVRCRGKLLRLVPGQLPHQHQPGLRVVLVVDRHFPPARRAEDASAAHHA